MTQLAHSRRLPHAMLFLGPSGTGKALFAENFVRAILCRDPAADGSHCGACKSCTLYDSGSHPDIVTIMPEEPGKAIKIDQVRQLQAFVSLTSQYGGYKFVVITPADAMNTQAASCLLKTLEEPADNTVIILVGHHASALLPTIRSRCQKIMFPLPPVEDSIAWLQTQNGDLSDPVSLLALAGSAPLTAKAMLDEGALAKFEELAADLHELAENDADAIKLADKWQEYSQQRLFSWIHLYLTDLVRLAMNNNYSRIRLAGQHSRLQHLAERLDLPVMYRLLDAVRDCLRLVHRQTNAQMLLEDFFILWAGITTDSNKKHLNTWA
jgi:DNA polymerase-3 subunit delta'